MSIIATVASFKIKYAKFQMQIIVSQQHLDHLTDLTDYARKKAEKLVKFNSKIQKISIHLIAEKLHRGQEHDYYCQIEIDMPGKNLSLIDTQRSLDKAIDNALERAKRLIIKSKEKRISRKHKEGVVSKTKSEEI